MELPLIFACGNTLRGDDGVAWWIAGQLEQDVSLSGLNVEFSQQLLPEMAEPVSRASLVVFIDCSATADPGAVSVQRVEPATDLPRLLTHHLQPSSILRMAIDYYGRCAPEAYIVTVGGSSFGMCEDLSEPVALAVPCAVLTVKQLLSQQGPLPTVASSLASN